MSGPNSDKRNASSAAEYLKRCELINTRNSRSLHKQRSSALVIFGKLNSKQQHKIENSTN